MPGTYAGNYLDDDPNPAFGGIATAGLFALAFALEIFRLFTEVFSGITIDADVFALVRVGLFALALIVLWVGGGAARWILAVGAFLFGSGLLVNTMQLPREMLRGHVYAIASLALGFTYLGVFAYMAFSANVVAFAKSQRAPGKAFSVVRMVVFCLGTLACLLAMRPAALYWHAVETGRATAFAQESIRTITAHYDPADFDRVAAPEYVAAWPVEAKKAVLQRMSAYGAAQTIGGGNTEVLGSFDLEHGLRWHGYYRTDNGGITFERAKGEMNLEMERGVFTPWRITAWTMSSSHVPGPPPPASQ